jgi:TP901 family phage tail tape measure protein
MADIPVRVIIDAIDNASKTLQGVGNKVTGVGSAMVAIGAAPAAALALATKTAIDFESAFAGIRKTVDASEAEFKQLETNIRGIAKTAPVSATELSKIGELAGQLGVRGVDNLTNFVETISKIGVTTNMTSEEAATAFARIANVMQEPISNVDRMGSVVVDLGNNMATTEGEITAFATRIAGAGKIAGLTTAEVFSIGAAMSSVGIEAEAGGTAVQKVLLEMNTAVVNGGEALGTFAKVAGVSAKDFQKAFKEDAAGAFQQFVEGIAARGDEAVTVFDEIGMTDVRLMRAFLSLANAGDVLNSALDTGTKAWDENRAMVQEAEKRYATTESQMQIFRNNLTDIGITVGSVILPALNNMMKALAPAISGFAKFADEHPKLIVGIVGFVAAIGLLGAVLVPLGILISSISTIIGGLAAVWGVVATVMAGPVVASIAAVMVPLLPIIAVIAAIAAIVGLLALAWQNNWFDIQGKVQVAGEMIGMAIETVKTFLIGLRDFIVALPETFNAFIESLKAGIYVFFTETLPYAIGFFAGRLVKFVTEDIPAFITSAINWFQQLPTRISAFLTQLKDSIIQRFNESKDNAIKTTTDLVTTVLDWFSSLPGKISAWLSALPGVISQWFTDAKDKAIGIAKQLYDGVKEWFDKVIGFFKDIVDWAGKAIGKAKEAASAGFDAGRRQFGGPVNPLSPVMVGEAGPEMFVPQAAGKIVPAHETGRGGGGTTIQFIINSELIVNSPTERRSIAEALYKDLVALARSQNMSVAEMLGG